MHLSLRMISGWWFAVYLFVCAWVVYAQSPSSTQTTTAQFRAMWRADVVLIGGYNGSTGPMGPMPPTTQFFDRAGNPFNDTARIGPITAYNLSIITSNQTRLFFPASGHTVVPTGQTLQFPDAAGDTVTLGAPTNIVSSYTLQLPPTAPSNEESVCMSDLSGQLYFKPLLPPILTGTATATASTASTAFAILTGMQLTVTTPGTYLVTFVGTFDCAPGVLSTCYVGVQLYVAGVPVAYTLQLLDGAAVAGSALSTTISTVLSSLTTGQVISIQWKRFTSGTANAYARNVYAIRLGP